jgi:hypothetical protein
MKNKELISEIHRIQEMMGVSKFIITESVGTLIDDLITAVSRNLDNLKGIDVNIEGLLKRIQTQGVTSLLPAEKAALKNAIQSNNLFDPIVTDYLFRYYNQAYSGNRASSFDEMFASLLNNISPNGEKIIDEIANNNRNIDDFINEKFGDASPNVKRHLQTRFSGSYKNIDELRSFIQKELKNLQMRFSNNLANEFNQSKDEVINLVREKLGKRDLPVTTVKWLNNILGRLVGLESFTGTKIYRALTHPDAANYAKTIDEAETKFRELIRTGGGDETFKKMIEDPGILGWWNSLTLKQQTTIVIGFTSGTFGLLWTLAKLGIPFLQEQAEEAGEAIESVASLGYSEFKDENLERIKVDLMSWVEKVKNYCENTDTGTWNDQKCMTQISENGKSLQVLESNEPYDILKTVTIKDLSDAADNKKIIKE